MSGEIKGPEQIQFEKWAQGREMVKVFLKSRKSIYGWIEWVTGESIAISGTTELVRLPTTSLYIINRDAIAYVKDFQMEQRVEPQRVEHIEEYHFLQKWMLENSHHRFRLFEGINISGRVVKFDQSVININGNIMGEKGGAHSEFMVFRHAIIFMI